MRRAPPKKTNNNSNSASRARSTKCYIMESCFCPKCHFCSINPPSTVHRLSLFYPYSNPTHFQLAYLSSSIIMSPVAAFAPTSVPSVTETPSKKAAAAVEAMSLQSPIKKPNFDAMASDEAETVTGVSKSAEYASRRKYVGDVDLDEKDEPLLKESKRRFVLFPIQYKEVSSFPYHSALLHIFFFTRLNLN